MGTARIGIVVIVATLAVAGCGSGAVGPSGDPSPTPAVTPASPAIPRPEPTNPSAPTPAPDAEPVVTITCEGADASASAPAVRARPDGVHLEAVRPDGSPATVDVATEERGWVASTGGAAALVLAPGPYVLSCLDPDAAEGTRAEVLVTDPDSLWKPGGIECEGGGGTTGSGDERPVTPEEAIPFLRSIVLNFRPDDVLEPAGYPDAPSGWIRLVRDGRVAASWLVVGAGGSVSFGSTEHCPDADIRYRASE